MVLLSDEAFSLLSSGVRHVCVCYLNTGKQLVRLMTVKLVLVLLTAQYISTYVIW